MNKLYIAVGNTKEYGETLLLNYTGLTRPAVEKSILDKANREGYKGNIEERLAELGWEIGEFKVERMGWGGGC